MMPCVDSLQQRRLIQNSGVGAILNLFQINYVFPSTENSLTAAIKHFHHTHSNCVYQAQFLLGGLLLRAAFVSHIRFSLLLSTLNTVILGHKLKQSIVKRAGGVYTTRYINDGKIWLQKKKSNLDVCLLIFPVGVYLVENFELTKNNFMTTAHFTAEKLLVEISSACSHPVYTLQ